MPITFLKEEVIKAQEQAVPMCRKTNRQGRRPIWLNRELLLGHGKKNRIYHLWKKGQVTQEEYRGLIRLCREETRKAKAQLKLSLAAVIRDNKNAGGNIATKDEEKAEVLNAFFTSVFNSQSDYSQSTEPPELEDRDGGQNKAPIIHEEAVNNLLCHLDTHKSMGPVGIHPRVLRELVRSWPSHSPSSISSPG